MQGIEILWAEPLVPALRRSFAELPRPHGPVAVGESKLVDGEERGAGDGPLMTVGNARHRSYPVGLLALVVGAVGWLVRATWRSGGPARLHRNLATRVKDEDSHLHRRR